ncbi:MAG TPA: DUF4358 domain-containing protein [Candidatus Faecalibacterium intestinigallinarum]|uniref:DUF4358 domain-containing protein n=1 Tax=Candidatus Faecalibacterium intestinigallinarum TaxID=2838581 RepID=A0A9D1Q7Q3_9FIRM|nr:DUF4358 domain-containing protein [Candidatus Faecalibacterium intestinigallinarum]
MMKRKLFALFTALTLCAALLAGCGGSSSAGTASSAPASEAASEAASGAAEARTGAENGAPDLDAAVSALLEANPISNQFEIAAMNIEYDFMLAAEDVVSYKGVKSNDNGDAGLVLVIQPAEGRAEAICEALDTYKQDQVAFYGNYAEFGQAQANVQNAIISGSDSLVVMLIASNECTSDAAALSAAVDDVMNAQ